MESETTDMNQYFGNFERRRFILLFDYITTNNVKMVEWFLEHYAPQRNFYEEDLFRAVYHKRCVEPYNGAPTINLVLFLISKLMPKKWKQMLVLLVQRNITIKGTDKRGNTALLLISPFVMKKRRTYMMTKFLLENGADPNIKNNEGRTALLNIIYHAFIDKPKLVTVHKTSLQQTIKLFIKYNINLNEPDCKGKNMLHYAVRMPKLDVDILILLIGNGSHIDAKDKSGSTPLNYATAYSCFENISTLLKNGANVHIADSNHFTPLHIAAKRNDWKIVELLLNYGACTDIHKENLSYRTPIHSAYRAKSIQSIKLLLRCAINTEIPKGTYHNTLLFNSLFQPIPKKYLSKCNWILKSQINIEKIIEYLLKYNSIANVTNEMKTLILSEVVIHVKRYDWQMINNIKSKFFKENKTVYPMLHFQYFMDNNPGKKLDKKTLRIARMLRTYRILQKSCKNILNLIANYGPNNLNTADNCYESLIDSFKIGSELQNFTSELLLTNDSFHWASEFTPSLYHHVIVASSREGCFYLYHKKANFICTRTIKCIDLPTKTFTGFNMKNLMLLIIRELQISNRLIAEDYDGLNKFLEKNKLYENEINKMIITKIGYSTITYFEFALANKQRLSTILLNNDIYRIFDNYRYRNYFPNFKYHLEGQFLIGRERMKLLDECSYIFLTQTVFQSENIVRLIVPHLSNDDLTAMMEAFST